MLGNNKKSIGFDNNFFTNKSGFSFDPDATAFFLRVTTAGGSLTATEKSAVNQLVLDMKTASIWTSMKAVYPMVGASAAACAQNLKSSSFTGTFFGGWTYSANGVIANSTNTYFDTTCIINTNLTPTNYGAGFYKLNNNSSASPDLGAVSANFNIYSNFDGGTTYMRGISASPDNFVNAFANGFYHQYGKTSASTGFYKNIKKLTGGAGNISGTNTVCLAGNIVILSTSATYAFLFLSTSLTDTNATNLYTTVQAFQTTLSRQV